MTESIFRSDSEDFWDELASLYRPGLLTAIQNALVGRLPKTGLNYVARCLREPSRNTESSVRSTSGIYPSRKLGRAIGFESATVELPTIRSKERDVECIALLDQGHAISIRARSGGRWVGYMHRPDFVCIELGRVVLIECKTLEGIEQKNAQNPGFFVFEGGRWTCPAATEEASKYGFEYEVWTDLDFTDIEIRNARVIDEYLCGKTSVYNEQVQVLCSYMDRNDGRTLQQVLEDLEGQVTVDGIYAAIARDAVAFDLNSTLLTKLTTAEVFRDEATMRAAQLARAKPLVERPHVDAGDISLSVGRQVMWNGIRWRCMSIAENNLVFAPNADVQPISLGAYQPLTITTFLLMVRSGEMTLVDEIPRDAGNDRVAAMINAATHKDLLEANRRYELVAAHLADGAKGVDDRSTRRYVEKYLQALRELGNGYVGLLPLWRDAGNRSIRIPDPVMKRAVGLINEHYLTHEQPSVLSVYRRLTTALEEDGYRAPSYRWFCGLIKAIPTYEALLARTGRKGAYKFEPRIVVDARKALPVAERAFGLAHVDHTKIDLVVTTDGEPVRLWLTVMLCAATKRVLASALSFEPPSYRQVLLVFRDCVRRHSRLPEAIMVDGGKEFRSVWFESVCALYQVRVHRRAKSKPRFGAEGERFFGSINTMLLYNMVGNTQNTRQVRQLTPETDPYRHALWTLSALKDVLEKFMFETYDCKTHSSLLMSPRAAAKASQDLHGTALHRFLSFNETFLILTSSTTSKGKAKVQPDGVKINYLYYNHPRLRERLGESLPVRYDPFNLANAWAHIDGAWLKLTSRFASVLINHSEHDVAVVTAAWRERRKQAERDALSETDVIELLREISQRQEWLRQMQQSNAERCLRDSDAGALSVATDQPVEEVVKRSSEPTSSSRPQRLRLEGDLLKLEVLQ